MSSDLEAECPDAVTLIATVSASDACITWEEADRIWSHISRCHVCGPIAETIRALAAEKVKWDLGPYRIPEVTDEDWLNLERELLEADNPTSSVTEPPAPLTPYLERERVEADDPTSSVTELTPPVTQNTVRGRVMADDPTPSVTVATALVTPYSVRERVMADNGNIPPGKVLPFSLKIPAMAAAVAAAAVGGGLAWGISHVEGKLADTARAFDRKLADTRRNYETSLARNVADMAREFDRKLADTRREYETSLAIRDLEGATAWKAEEQLGLTGTSSVGIETHDRSTIALASYRRNLIREVSSRRERSPRGMAYDEAVTFCGLKVREKHRDQRPTLVLNGGDSSNVTEYTYTQAAVDQIATLLGRGDAIRLDDDSKRQLISLIRSQSSNAVPELIRQQLKGSGGLLPIVIVVQAQALPGGESKGKLNLFDLDPEVTSKSDHFQVDYTQSDVPTPLFERFRQTADLKGEVTLPEISGNKATITLKGDDSGFASVSLTTADTVPRQRRFAEIVFEAKADQSEPLVEFRTGGGSSEDSPLVGLPPIRLGPEYRRFSIPIDLAESESWQTGLSVLVSSLNDDKGIVISIRNAFIRPFGENSRRSIGTVGPAKGGFKQNADEIGAPYIVYGDTADMFIPGAIMPDGRGLRVRPGMTEAGAYSGKRFARLSYTLDQHPWVSVGFLLENSFTPRRRFDLYKALGARKGDRIVLRLYARSAGGAKARLQVGGHNNDPGQVESQVMKFGPEWALYQVDVTNLDLTSLHGALTVVLDAAENQEFNRPVIELDLDQVYFTKLKPLP